MRLHPKSGWITLILTLGTINLPAEYVWKNFVGLPGGSGNVDGPVSTARFYNPSGITIDNTGQIYIADQLNYAIRKISISGQVTTLAGSSGLQGSVNGIGAAAMFSHPSALVSDPSGNIYVTDDFNHTIRKITPSGVVTTFAGLAGQSGSADGPANDARFKRPFAIARGSDDTLYVAEYDNHTIRKIAADGTVSTLAGAAGQAGTVDGNGSTARFNTPCGIAVSPDGHVYVSDSSNHTLRKITPSGDVTTLAGSVGIFAFADGTGTEARFHNPRGLALSPSGQLYVADAQNGRVRVVSPAGVVTTLAGGHSSRSADGVGSAAGFYVPNCLCLEANGSLLVADSANSLIRRISPTGTVTTVAGVRANAGYTAGKGSLARLTEPSHTTMDSAGNLIVFAAGFWKISQDGTVTPITLSGPNSSSFQVSSIAVDSSGVIFVADSWNDVIRKISTTGAVSLFAGQIDSPGYVDATGTAARFDEPKQIAISPAGNIYVADAGSHKIRRISQAGVVTTVPNVTYNSGTDIRGLVAISDTNIIFSDFYSAIFKHLAGNTQMFAGTRSYGSADGQGTSARFRNPHGLDVDAAGNIYVADFGNSTIRRISATGMVSTIGGLALQTGGADGIGAAARFSYPRDLSVTPEGKVYVADTFNHRIIMGGDSPEITASPVSVQAATRSNTTLGVSATGTGPLKYQWRRNGIDIPKATSSTLALTDITLAKAGNYSVLVKNDFGSVLSQIAIVALNNQVTHNQVTLTATPGNVTAGLGQTASFVVQSPQGTGFQWYRGTTLIRGATQSSFSISPVTASQAGLYSVKVTGPGGSVTTQPAMLAYLDEQLLVYKITGTGSSYQLTSVSRGSVSGILILDRFHQRAGIIWQENNGKLKTHRIEFHEDLHTQSTGPVPGSHTVVAELKQQGTLPNEDNFVIWLRGIDSLLKISPTDLSIGPATMKGSIETTDTAGGLVTETVSLNLTLDPAASAKARAAFETVEQAITRLNFELINQGSISQP